MSMHLAGPGLTTTSYKKRKQKITKAQQAALESGWRERNVRLKAMGLPKETFEQYMEWVYGRGKKTKAKIDNRSESKKAVAVGCAYHQKTKNDCNKETNIDSKNAGKDVGNLELDKPKHKHWTTGACATKPSPTYTGTKMIGIGTMHKSNMVPIFSDEEAKDISKMRR